MDKCHYCMGESKEVRKNCPFCKGTEIHKPENVYPDSPKGQSAFEQGLFPGDILKAEGS